MAQLRRQWNGPALSMSVYGRINKHLRACRDTGFPIKDVGNEGSGEGGGIESPCHARRAVASRNGDRAARGYAEEVLPVSG